MQEKLINIFDWPFFVNTILSRLMSFPSIFDIDCSKTVPKQYLVYRNKKALSKTISQHDLCKVIINKSCVEIYLY